MKRIIGVIIIFFILFQTGCSKNEPNKITKDNSVLPTTQTESNIQTNDFTNTMHTTQEIKLVRKSEKAKYLLSNGIKVKYDMTSLKTSKGDVPAFLPHISGLEDKTLEKKLNKSIQDDILNEVKNYTSDTEEKPQELSFMVNLNANNLLSIIFYDFYSPPMNGFLYRLSDGKRLNLEDIFTKGTDYVSLINQKVVENILSGQEEEENILKEPFTTIKPNQKFALSSTNLYMIFSDGEGGFANKHTVNIPLSSIDDYVDIIDRYSVTNQKKTDALVRVNNIFITSKGEIIKKNIGDLWCHYPQFSGLRNDDFEKIINNTIKDGVYEVTNNKLWDKPSENTTKEDNHAAAVQMQTSFNHYGILCITRNAYKLGKYEELNNFYKVYTFDLKSKKTIDAKTLLINYAKKNKNFEESFSNIIKQHMISSYSSNNVDLTNKINDNVNYAFIKDKALVFFRQLSQDDPISIVILLKENIIKGVSTQMECEFPLKDVVKGSLDDFFGV